MTDSIFHILLAVTWQSMVLAAFVLLIVFAFRERLAPRFRYLLWCVVLLRLALPILPATPWGVLPNQNSMNQSRDGHGAVAMESAPTPMRPPDHSRGSDWSGTDNQSRDGYGAVVAGDALLPVQPLDHSRGSDSDNSGLRGFDWQSHAKWGVLIVWLSGIIIFGIRYVCDELRLYRQSRCWKPIEDANLLAMFESCRKQLGIRRRVALLAVSHGIGAASTGTLFPKVLLAEHAAMRATDDQLRMVLLHELVHLKRFDPLVLRVSVILSVIHWLNPVAWLAMSRLQRDRELACDAAVLHKLGSHDPDGTVQKDYGGAVLAFATLFSPREHLPGLVGLFPKHAIARRIEMILNYKKSNLFYAALGVVLVTAVAAFGLTSAQSQKEENATQTQNDGKTLVYGRVVDESGKPAVGAIVRANIMTGNEFCITDADGNFVLPVKNPYRWTTFWAVSADGNQLGQGCPKILEGETTIRKVEVTLKKDVRIITGKVVDGEGKPVQDAWVGGTGQCAKPLLVQSDSEGQFRFPWPGDETLQRVYAFKDHLGFDFAGTDEPDSAEGIIIPEKIDNGPFMLVLQRPQTVKIRVVDENKKIIPGAIVSTWLIRKKDAREGRNHKEFNTAFGPWQTNTRTDTNGIAVFDWIPTENISQILFTAYGDHVKGNLREDGTVRFFGSDEVRYEPNAEKDKWWEYEECKNGQCHLVKEGETEKWIYETDRQGIVNLTLPRSARVLGTVKYSDGSPVPYTFVSRKSHNQCGHGLQFTNEKGEFELDENANFLLNLAAESTKECAPAIFAYNVGDGTEVQKLDIVLQKGVKLHGTVYDSEEKPVHGLFAVWIYEKNPDPACPDDVSIRQTSNYDTQDVPVYHYILPPGKFTVHANHQDQYSEEQDIEIKPGQTGEIQLDLHVKKKQEKGSDSEVSEAKNAGQTEKQTNTQTNIQMSDTDALLFGNGKWTNEKTGNVIPDGSIVQGTQGTFRLEQENGEGKVVRLSGAGASGHAEYVRFSDGGNKIVVSRVSFELQKKLDKEFAESGIRIGMDDVFVFENGEWKNEKTGNVIPAGTLVAGTQGFFRIEVENGEGKITPVIGGGATGHGKYIRWSHGGNGISENSGKP